MTTLYRLRAADDELLYVGVTDDLDRRIAQHRRVKPWWPLVASVEAEAFARRPDAFAAERVAIARELPRFNIRGAPVPFPGAGFDDRESYRQALADYMDARLVGTESIRGEDVYLGWREYARASDLSPAAYTRRQIFNFARVLGWHVTREPWVGVTLHPLSS